MDRDSTPRGGPAPKKAHFANRQLEDSNIEQTLLMDTVNVSANVPTYSAAKSFNSTAPKPPLEATQNEFDDSLAELTCGFKPVTPAAFAAPSVSLLFAPSATTYSEHSLFTSNAATRSTEPVVSPVSAKPEPTETFPVLASMVTSSVASMSLECPVINPLVEAMAEALVQPKDESKVDRSLTRVDEVTEPMHEVTVIPIPNVDIMTLIQEALDLEIEMPPVEQLEELRDQVSVMEFLAAEHLATLINKEKPKTEEGVADAVTKCARMIIGLVKSAEKKSFELVQRKDRADFECMLAVEREKVKSMGDERQMLRDRIAEVEKAHVEAIERCNELSRETKRLQQLANEADELESQLMKCKAENQKLNAKLETKK